MTDLQKTNREIDKDTDRRTIDRQKSSRGQSGRGYRVDTFRDGRMSRSARARAREHAGEEAREFYGASYGRGSLFEAARACRKIRRVKTRVCKRACVDCTHARVHACACMSLSTRVSGSGEFVAASASTSSFKKSTATASASASTN